jgi:hypothetical protein
MLKCVWPPIIAVAQRTPFTKSFVIAKKGQANCELPMDRSDTHPTLLFAVDRLAVDVLILASRSLSATCMTSLPLLYKMVHMQQYHHDYTEEAKILIIMPTLAAGVNVLGA